jgi:hypothetical protein
MPKRHIEIPEKKEIFNNLCMTYFKSLILENTSFTI